MPPARARLLRRVTPLLLVIGAVVMVAFEHWFTLLAGVVLMLAFVVCGAFLIADPHGFLDRDGDDEPDPDEVMGDDRRGAAAGS